ncbi:complex I intermediate-associated protein 30, mitochondrial [Folsomia candida]|uniref:Complex I intermediate-associated protein 30, mitochondrial n=1 Tax=Folsomia candida TaxID=158441 RepID=A0A226ERI3_FOLCA|nr:complex I intermediate-associated protein 30, mitochondrial [Folsomia candida]OXA60119.1 Complex I intermediate-associated protein 30, mitochondrial [Folsomia candida]
MWKNTKLFHDTCRQCRRSLFPSNERGIQSTSVSNRFWESSPRGEYRDQKKFAKEYEKEQLKKLWGLKDGFRDLRDEVFKWTKEVKDHVTGDDSHLWVIHGDRDPVWTFNNKNTLSQFQAFSDSDHNEGFSKCELVMSPTGKGLFQGFVNTRPPKDGRVKYAGYCIMKSNDIVKSFKRRAHMDWSNYTHLVMRVRGDGRSFVINLSVAGFYDITWNDVYHYVLFTRGGPYWQFVKIPFSKFVMASKGRTQDFQERVPLTQISSFGIAAAKVDGPFSLEIDYVGLECDESFAEEFAYEMYRVPKYIANV